MTRAIASRIQDVGPTCPQRPVPNVGGPMTTLGSGTGSFIMAALRRARMQNVVAARIERHGLGEHPHSCDHRCCSGDPVIPVGVCGGVEDSDGFTLM